jgi:hypothetical protein
MAGHTSDALVIGAGPAGLVTAAMLARAGHQVTVVEHTAEPCPGVLVLTPPGQEVMQELGWLEPIAGLPGARQARQLVLASPQERLVLDQQWHTLLVPRRDALIWLATAAEEAGALLLRERAAAVPLLEGHRVVGIRTRDLGGGEQALRARVVVDASGSGSFLAATFGLLNPRRGPRRTCITSPISGESGQDHLMTLVNRNWLHIYGNGWLSAVLQDRDDPSRCETDLAKVLARGDLGLACRLEGRPASTQPWPAQPRAVAGGGWVAVGMAAGSGGPGLPGLTSRGLVVAASVALEIDLALRHGRSLVPSQLGATVTLIRHAVHLESLLDRALARSADMSLLAAATAGERRRRLLSSMLQGRWDVPRERLLRILYLWWLDRRSRAVMRRRGR